MDDPTVETRSRRARILRNTAVLAGTGIVTKIGLLVFTVYAANLLGPGKFGDYAFLMAAISVAIVLADMGVENYAERELARDQRLLGSRVPLLAAMRFVGVGAAGVILALVTGLTEVGRRTPWLIAIGPALLVAMGIFQMLRAGLRSTEKMEYEAGLNLGERFGFMILAALFLLLGWGLAGFVGAQAVATVLGIAAALCFLRRLVGGAGWTWPMEAAKLAAETYRRALPFGLSALCVIVLYRADALLLRFLAGAEETGRYGVAFRVMEGFFLFPQMVGLAIYPSFSIAYHRRDPLGPLYHPLLRGLAVLGTGGVVVGILAAPPLFSVFKPEYREATGMLTILLLAVPFVYGNYLVGTTLRAADRQVQNLIASALAMVVSLAANVALIPSLGGEGAALAVLLTQGFYFVFMSAQAWRLVDGGRMLPMLLKVAAIGGAAWWAGARFEAWYVRILAGAVVFCVSSVVFGAARARDISSLLAAIRTRAPETPGIPKTTPGVERFPRDHAPLGG